MDILNILNTIRDNASALYQERIPEATRSNMESIRFAMLDDDNVQVANEFMHTLLNKVVKTQLISKVFSNPLAPLKKGTKPLGDTVEEIYNNFIKGEQSDFTGANLLKRNLPDTKTVYHRMNKQHTYTVTVDRARLSKAFTSYESLENYINNIVNTLYNSANFDEFMEMKQLLKSALDANALIVKEISDPLTSADNAKKFIKAVKTVSGLMCFPSGEFNAYTSAQTTDEKPVITFSTVDDQYLIIDTATNTTVDVDVLANTFNMSVADFNKTKKIVVDAIPIEGARAALVDKEFLQVFDDLFAVKAFENPLGLYTNYYLHVHQTLAYSILVNAVLFKVKTA